MPGKKDYDKQRNETREECVAWVEKDFGPEARRIVEEFIDCPENHPFEDRRELFKELLGIKNQHDLPQRKIT